jgi:hypothetical protein
VIEALLAANLALSTGIAVFCYFQFRRVLARKPAVEANPGEGIHCESCGLHVVRFKMVEKQQICANCEQHEINRLENGIRRSTA